MPTVTLTLADFLLARIAEDEACARAAQQDDGLIAAAVRADRAAQGMAADVHFIARHDPARVLADVEAKRRIVERCAPLDDLQVRRQTRTLAHDVLWVLALPYAEHPDYLDEWRP